MYLVRLASGIVYKRHVDQLIAVGTAPVTDQTVEVITAESQQTARSDCADDSPVGSNRTADAPRHSISVRPSTAMSPNASHTHTTYTSPITQRSPLARSTPVRRYPQRERKPITSELKKAKFNANEALINSVLNPCKTEWTIIAAVRRHTLSSSPDISPEVFSDFFIDTERNTTKHYS
ncbi:hypothetical protein J6590_064190 [Homalodisca vitripennis]|nr:hypothetical protein J6590_064190 [Homalodisca vitripennis]